MSDQPGQQAATIRPERPVNRGPEITSSSDADVAAPALTKDRIVSALRDEADHIEYLIAVDQKARDDANARIKANRGRLDDVQRILRASEPRKRKTG